MAVSNILVLARSFGCSSPTNSLAVAGFYRPYVDQTLFEYEIILTRDDKEAGIDGERYILTVSTMDLADHDNHCYCYCHNRGMSQINLLVIALQV